MRYRKLKHYRDEMVKDHPCVHNRMIIYEVYLRWLPHLPWQDCYKYPLMQMLEQNNRHINKDKR